MNTREKRKNSRNGRIKAGSGLGGGIPINKTAAIVTKSPRQTAPPRKVREPERELDKRAYHMNELEPLIRDFRKFAERVDSAYLGLLVTEFRMCLNQAKDRHRRMWVRK